MLHGGHGEHYQEALPVLATPWAGHEILNVFNIA